MLVMLRSIREDSVAATKVELFERIRRDSWREGLSVRALARKYGVHRRLVREALTRAEPAPRKTPVRRSPRLEPFKEVIDEWLRADLDAPRKQRHTVKRIHARLVGEHGAAGVSYSALRDYVSRRRPEIRIEEGRAPAQVFVPQHHPPGQDAEVDFGELWVRLAGVMTKCFLFVFRLSYSGKAVHKVFATCGQEAFLEGHVHAFTALGGVPAGQVRYDNLTAAVRKVLLRGRARVENPRWTAFRSHFRFEAFYCEPGQGHEKPRVAYCTSSGCSVRSSGSGWSGVLGPAADLRPVGRVAGVGRVVKELSLVVIAGAGDNPGSAPGLDGVVADAVGGGGFGEGEHAGGTESLAAAA
jgi:transposase